jgi:hypothetical protein
MLFVGLTFTLLLSPPPRFFSPASRNGAASVQSSHRPSKHSLTIVFLISASLIGTGIFLTRRNVEHPRRDTLIDSVNADENKAKWVSYDAIPDAWTINVLGSKARRHPDPAYTVGLDRPVLTGEATPAALDAPFVAVSQNFVSDGEQTITLQIASRRDARLLVVRLPGDVKLSAAGWNGDVQPIHDTSHSNLPWTFRFYNAPPEGVTLEFHFPAQNGIKVWIADATSGFSAVAPPPPRPDDTTPGYGSDITLVAGAHDF